jgi:hypothetical protein
MAKAKTITRKMDSDVESGYAVKKDIANMALMERIQLRKANKGRAEKLAGDFQMEMKWQFPEARECFPDEPWMRFVDKYFPFAKGGALLVDEPMLDEQIERCKRKAIVLKELGYRYIMLKPISTEAEDYMELEQCGQPQPMR